MATDYKTRLTADTSQHDRAINKSAQQIYQYKKQTDTAKTTLAGLAKKFGPLAAQIGIAGGALAVFGKAIKSTEAGTDALARTMQTTQTTVNHFFKAISTGSFDSFVNGLSDIVTTAKEAYNALDDLSTMKMWKNMRINQLRAQVAEDRVIVNNSKSSEADRNAAQQRIDLNMQKIQALTGDLIEQAEKAADAVLKKLAGADLSPYALRNYMQMRENGTLAAYMEDYKKRMSKTTEYYTTVGGGISGYTQQVKTSQTTWNNGYAQQQYEAMQRLYNATDEEINEWVALQNDISLQREQTAMQQAKADKLINKGNESGSGSKGKGYEVGSIADIEHQINALRDRLKNEVVTPAVASDINAQIEALQNKKAAIEMQLTFGVHGDTPAEVADNLVRMLDGYFAAQPAELPVEIDADTAVETWKGIEDAINAEWQKFVEAKKRDLEDLASVTNEWNTILAQTGSMFESIGQLGDENFAKVMGGIGDIVASLGSAMGTIGETIAKYNALALSKGLASASELPFPYNLGAIATVVASIMSVIGTVASVATQKFAGGGIVQGQTTIGDYIPIHANAGEMVLSTKQQNKLFKMLNSPTVTTTSTAGGNVTFTIHGSDLQGALNNYNKMQRRVK